MQHLLETLGNVRIPGHGNKCPTIILYFDILINRFGESSLAQPAKSNNRDYLQ